MRTLVLVAVVLLTGGCPGEIPAPRTVPIVADGSGRPEVTEFVEVHVVPVRNRSEGEVFGAVEQEALVAWISSWQHLEIIDFEHIGGDTSGNLLVVAKRRAQ